ncbi:hypothetical protein TWF718_003364 [Orbilia javanica]|uniref:Uncharacterized protein n=1 Tax=Orbilia javanica TaxID=47235 RepID=A0AAN8RBB3_9PEZI
METLDHQYRGDESSEFDGSEDVNEGFFWAIDPYSEAMHNSFGVDLNSRYGNFFPNEEEEAFDYENDRGTDYGFNENDEHPMEEVGENYQNLEPEIQFADYDNPYSIQNLSLDRDVPGSIFNSANLQKTSTGESTLQVKEKHFNIPAENKVIATRSKAQNPTIACWVEVPPLSGGQPYFYKLKGTAGSGKYLTFNGKTNKTWKPENIPPLTKFFTPEPDKNNYVEVKQDLRAFQKDDFLGNWPAAKTKVYISVRFMNAIARRRVPWEQLNQEFLGSPFEREQTVGELQLAKVDISESDERILNFNKIRLAPGNEPQFKFPAENQSKDFGYRVPVRLPDGLVVLATLKTSSKVKFPAKIGEWKEFERPWCSLWKSLKRKTSTPGGNPPRHSNINFDDGIDKPFWIKILPAGIARFKGGRAEAIKMFSKFIDASNTSKSKYNIKMGLFSDDGEPCMTHNAGGECVAPNERHEHFGLGRITTSQYVFVSENPFQLYQTWIHRDTLIKYIKSFAESSARQETRPFPKEGDKEKINEENDKIKVLQNNDVTKRMVGQVEGRKLENDEWKSALEQSYQDEGVVTDSSVKTIWNPLIVPLSSQKIATAKGNRTGTEYKSQGAIMGSAPLVGKNAFGWMQSSSSLDNKAKATNEPDINKKKGSKGNAAATSKEGEEGEEGMEDEEDALVGGKGEVESGDGEDKYDDAENETLKMKNGLYTAEWLHLSAFSWGGLCANGSHMTSQVPGNLIFGTSEANTVMTRYEKSWQDLFVAENQIREKMAKTDEGAKGWLIIERDDPNLTILQENLDNDSGENQPCSAPGGHIFRKIQLKDKQFLHDLTKKYPWLCFGLRYTVRMSGYSWILDRKDPICTVFFYPFSRLFFHSVEYALDKKLHNCMIGLAEEFVQDQVARNGTQAQFYVPNPFATQDKVPRYHVGDKEGPQQIQLNPLGSDDGDSVEGGKSRNFQKELRKHQEKQEGGLGSDEDKDLSFSDGQNEGMNFNGMNEGRLQDSNRGSLNDINEEQRQDNEDRNQVLGKRNIKKFEETFRKASSDSGSEKTKKIKIEKPPDQIVDETNNTAQFGFPGSDVEFLKDGFS